MQVVASVWGPTGRPKCARVRRPCSRARALRRRHSARLASSSRCSRLRASLAGREAQAMLNCSVSKPAARMAATSASVQVTRGVVGWPRMPITGAKGGNRAAVTCLWSAMSASPTAARTAPLRARLSGAPIRRIGRIGRIGLLRHGHGLDVRRLRAPVAPGQRLCVVGCRSSSCRRLTLACPLPQLARSAGRPSGL
jgi:hypothetical protein